MRGVDLEPGEGLDRAFVIRVLFGELDDPGQHRVLSPHQGAAGHHRIHQVLRHDRDFPQRVRALAGDENHRHRAQAQGDDQEPGSVDDVDNG